MFILTFSISFLAFFNFSSISFAFLENFLACFLMNWSFKNNNQKFFTEINTNSPLAYFLVDEGDFGHGMVLAAMYKTLIDLQNAFLNQIINSKSDILSCFNEQLSQETLIQDVQKNEIIDLDKINDEVFIDIILSSEGCILNSKFVLSSNTILDIGFSSTESSPLFEFSFELDFDLD